MIGVAAVLALAVACQQQSARTRPALRPPEQQTEVHPLAANSSPALKSIIDGAIDQIGKTTSYDPSYQKLDYPNGDVPIETGVCSDVIIRAFRKGNIDLQKDVHEDMKSNFSAYPTRWGLKSPDANIDHRRVPNLETYFARKGKAQAITNRSEEFLPGDLVTWDMGTGQDHFENNLPFQHVALGTSPAKRPSNHDARDGTALGTRRARPASCPRPLRSAGGHEHGHSGRCIGLREHVEPSGS